MVSRSMPGLTSSVKHLEEVIETLAKLQLTGDSKE